MAAKDARRLSGRPLHPERRSSQLFIRRQCSSFQLLFIFALVAICGPWRAPIRPSRGRGVEISKRDQRLPWRGRRRAAWRSPVVEEQFSGSWARDCGVPWLNGDLALIRRPRRLQSANFGDEPSPSERLNSCGERDPARIARIIIEPADGSGDDLLCRTSGAVGPSGEAGRAEPASTARRSRRKAASSAGEGGGNGATRSAHIDGPARRREQAAGADRACLGSRPHPSRKDRHLESAQSLARHWR